MKIDMTPAAVTRRLKQAAELRRACLSLARSSAGREVLKRHPGNRTVLRTIKALGHTTAPPKRDHPFQEGNS